MDERPVRRGGPREFEDLMTRGERLATGVYLPVHSVLMPLVLSALSVMSAGALDNLTLNAIMYSAGTLFTLLFLHKFLRRSFDVLAENLSQCVLTLFSALAMDFALSWLLSLVLALFGIVLGWGLVGIWMAFALDENLRAVLFIIRWKAGKWRNIKTV